MVGSVHGGGGGEGGSLGGEGGGGEEAMAVDGEVVEEAKGGGRWCAHTPCAPNTHCGVRGGYGLTTSTQSAVLKNTGAYPEGIIGSECSGGGQTPVT